MYSLEEVQAALNNVGCRCIRVIENFEFKKPEPESLHVEPPKARREREAIEKEAKRVADLNELRLSNFKKDREQKKAAAIKERQEFERFKKFQKESKAKGCLVERQGL